MGNPGLYKNPVTLLKIIIVHVLYSYSLTKQLLTSKLHNMIFFQIVLKVKQCTRNLYNVFNPVEGLKKILKVLLYKPSHDVLGRVFFLSLIIMNSTAFNGIQSIKFLIQVNFYISVIVLVAGGILSVSGSYSLFEFNEDLYGALDNNLRMIMVYLALTESVILGYCFFRKNFHVMIPVGFFLILMIGSMEFYGEINSIEIDANFPLFFLYTGISHILFGVMAGMEKNSANERNDKSRKQPE